MRNRLRRDYLLIIVSFFIAVILWSVVQDSKNPEMEVDLKGVPVSLTDNATGPSAAGLTVLRGEGQTISVRVRAKRNVLLDIKPSNVLATINLSGITRAGEYDLPVDIELLADGVSLVDVNPNRLPVKIDKMLTVEVPVKAVLDGEAARGYYAVEPVPEPAVVSVTGPAAEINYIEYALAEVRQDNFSGSFSSKANIVLYNKDGEETKSQYITCDTQSVDVAVTVYGTKTVPLRVITSGDVPDGYYYVGSSLSQDSVTIAGNNAALSQIGYINVEMVDLRGLTETTVMERNIVIPSGIINVSGSSKCSVEVEVEPYINSAVEIDGFEAVNIPDGVEIRYAYEPISVSVYGPKSVVEQMTNDDIVAVADMSALADMNDGRIEIGDYELDLEISVADNPLVTVTSEHKGVVTVTGTADEEAGPEPPVEE